MTLAAPTILEHGSDDLKSRLLRPIVTGEDSWCQLFSEPGSGSDLAGLTTRAELDGDEYVVNGQKLWSTSAHHARYGMLLARTNWDVPKHRGISYFAIEMHQPGVVVRPLRQMNGYASFNEVFFNDARVPAANAIGEVGNGWTVALATLAHERRSFDALQARGRSPKGKGRAIDENRAEIAELMEPYKWYPQRAGRVDLIIERAKATGRERGSGRAPGDREAALARARRGVDGPARQGRARARPSARARGLARQALREPDRARGRARAHADQRLRRAARAAPTARSRG